MTVGNSGHDAVNAAIEKTETVTINETPSNTTHKRNHKAIVNEIKSGPKTVTNKAKKKNSVKKFKSPAFKNSK